MADLATVLLPNARNASFASRVLDELELHPEMQSVARVSIVRRIGLANQLEVVSVAGRAEPNTMTEGYRCFVSPKGSLFQLSAHSLRTYGNADLIVKDYLREQKEPQRSIARIAEMGLRSGLCTAIFCDGYIHGFLFINAIDEILEKLPERLLPIVSYLAVAARHELGPCLEPLYFSVFHLDQARVTGATLNAERLANDIEFVSSRIDPDGAPLDVTINGTTSSRSLFVHANAAFLLVRIAAISKSRRLRVNIEVKGEAIGLHCEFEGGGELSPSSASLPVVLEQARLLGYSVENLSIRSVLLKTESDHIGAHQDLGYSVESTT